MKKRVVKGILLIYVMLQPLFMAAQEKEISVEEMYYQEINKDQKIPENVIFAQKIQEFLMANDINGAINAFSTMPESLKNDTKLKIVLASLYISNKDFKKAVEEANNVLALDPDNVDAYEIIAYASKYSGDEKKLTEINEKLLKKDPNNPAANITMAEKYVVSKEFKKARDYYKKALKGDEKNTDAIFGVALCSYYLDDIKEAKEKIDTLLFVDDKNSQGYALKAKIFSEENNYTKAVEMYEKSIEVGGPNYNTYLDLGLCYKEKNQTTKAIEIIKKAIEINGNYFLAYAYLAGIYDELNDVDNALNYYQKVIETNPDYYFAYEEIAILEFHLKNYKESIYYFEKAYSYQKNLSYMMMIAGSYLKLKDIQNAKKVLQSIMKGLDHDSVEYNMARFYHDSYSKNAESSLTQKLTKIDNSYDRGKMLFYMGLYYEINGFNEMAKEYYAKVTSMQAPMFFEYRLAEWGLAY